MPTIYIPHSIYAAICHHVEASYPYEACGLLTGITHHSGDISIHSSYPSRNLATEPHHAFILDPVTHIDVQKTARLTGQIISGIYHSHPDGQPTPSSTDKKNAVLCNFLWMIFAIQPTKELTARCFITLPEGNDFLEAAIYLI